MRDLTIGMAYYMNPGMLRVQYEHLASFPDDIKTHLRYIVVDDGSPKGFRAEAPKRDIGVPVQIWRMKKDIAWNQDACRNWAVKEAQTEWVLLTDMDHVPSAALINRIVSEPLELAVYTFARVNAPGLDPYKPHPNSWLLTRHTYEAADGYDERYRGVYGTDGMFRSKLQRTGLPFVELKDPIIRYPREVVPDASTTTLKRQSPENDKQKRLVRQRVKEQGLKPPHRFLTQCDRIA